MTCPRCGTRLNALLRAHEPTCWSCGWADYSSKPPDRRREHREMTMKARLDFLARSKRMVYSTGFWKTRRIFDED